MRREFPKYIMEIFISALVSELVSRSINFFISKSSKPKVQDVEDRLQWALLRAQVIINEATGWHITNEAMLQQLDMLREGMYQGNYILDTFRYQPDDGDAVAKDPVVSHCFSVSKVNSHRGICCSNRNTAVLQQMQDALDNLSSMILDVKELVVFLTSYRRLYRQPYSMHLQLTNCMFGRQMEAQLIISFLLHPRPHGSEELEVLPIVGPYRVGKSTLVSHVCKDERVRDRFSEILLLDGHDFTDYDHATLSKGYRFEHQNHALNSDKGMGLLVFELIGYLSEDQWNRLCSHSQQRVSRCCKIIVTSRSDKIIKFGTIPPLHLKYLSDAAYWYFFKTLTFESMDPKMHPRFAHVATEIARTLSVYLIGANYTASLLRKNFDIHFWCKILTFLRQLVQKNISNYGGHPFHLISQNKPAHFWRMATPSDDIVVYNRHQCSSLQEVPKINIQDVMYGNVKPQGKFELVSWRSPIPPYYCYVASCEIREKKSTATKRKRSTK